MLIISLLTLSGGSLYVECAAPVHTTYLWSVTAPLQTYTLFQKYPLSCLRHMQQPIYWPAVLPSNPSTYQKAYDSTQLKQSQGGHPKDNLDDIFGKGKNCLTTSHSYSAIHHQMTGLMITSTMEQMLYVAAPSILTWVHR